MSATNTISLKMSLSGIQAVESQLRGFTGKLASNLNAVRGAAAAAMAALGVGTIAHFTKEAINAADEAGKMAQKVGIAVEQLTAMQYAAKLADVDTGELAFAIKNLSQDMQKAGRGGEDVGQEILRLSDRFAQMRDGAAKTALAVDLFGRSGINMIPMLNQGGAAIRKQMEEAKAFGVVIGGTFSKNAESFNDNLTRMGMMFKGLFYEVAERLLPVLIKLQERFISFFSDIGARQFVAEALVGVFRNTALFLASMRQEFQQLALIFAEVKDAATGGKMDYDRWKKNSLESWQSYTRLVETLEKIGEQTDENTDAQDKNNKSLNDGVTLATKLASLQSRLKQLQGFGETTQFKGAEGRSAQVALLKDQLGIINQIREQPELNGAQMASGGLYSEKSIKILESQISLRKQEFEIQKQIRELTAQDSFGARLTENFDKMVESAGSVSRQVADAFTNTIGTAIDSISSGLTDAIMGAKTLGEAMRQVGRTILTEIISSIIRMGVQWVMTHILMRGAMILTSLIGSGLKKKETGETLAQEAIKAPALATNAASAAIGSYGAAAVVGAVLAIAALGAIIGFAMGGFREGGYTGGGGVNEVAGVAHRGEFVFSAPAVNRIGLGNLEAMHNGSAAPGGASGVAGSNVNVAFMRDHSDYRQWLMSGEGKKTIVDIVSGSRRQIGI